MIIALNNIQRSIRRKGVVFIFLMPIVFTAVYLMSVNPVAYNVGVVDLDNSVTSHWIADEIPTERLTYLGIGDDYDQLILAQTYDFILIIQANFEEEFLAGNQPIIETYFSEGNPISEAPQQVINRKIESLTYINTESKLELHGYLKRLNDGSFNIEKSQIQTENKDKIYITGYGIGILMMSMMFFSNSAAMKVNDDKNNGIYLRIMSGNVSKFRYSFEVIASLFFMVVIKVLLVMLIIHFILKGDFGPNPFLVFLVMTVYATSVVAITNLITALSKDARQANLISVFITTPIAMLGGCMWPISITPKPLQYVSNFVPTKWGMEAVGKIINGGGHEDVTLELGILSLFTVVIFLIASVKKVEMAK